ncbi:putative type iis restriction /modification enzyme, n-terminal half [hydrocarbon metagenome]|uniref:site-specific DNA-methyltransferase (adenine-specific) n=1 Tax=hydrocarbon metagenome TaxID=938273 RepID=A0A0W8F1A1_9ZZZZ
MEAVQQIPEVISRLVQSFEFHQAAYKRGQFNETQLRREFIDPFFKALGWDVDNTKRYSELYKEVIHEDPIRIRGSTEFIDYSFRIGGVRKFIVEAKKPAVNIRDDAGPALQIRRYAWNARLPLSILTDFEEFAVYDCTKKPMPGDTAATARIAYFTFQEYPEQWGYIASIFSQECILQGSFDRFAEGTKGKKGTATVDEAILADIEEWRDLLAKNIALRNTALTVDELNVAVQRTIDRILFLRICEDRGIEEYGCLQKLLEGQDMYQRLTSLFLRADTRYNSGIFHFNPEPGRDELPDTITLGLVIDDAVLKKIIRRLYYPESPYEFSVISPVILGQVYEQFLGKVIRLTPGHQAKVEYKPEVKKAGGVYYTPQYIVDYIVQHTVGELVKDRTPREVAKLRILDPACGSGSFLIGAYQYLLDWHLTWYIHNLVQVIAERPATAPEVQALLPEVALKTGKKRSGGDTTLPIYKATGGRSSRTRSDWKLTIAERKRILLNNIYGVDIDTQAVEVTKLSLLLKVLEEESQENVSKQLKLFDERALPSLHQNIKCGNSLIGTDIYTEIPTVLDDPEAAKRINAFDWDREFPEIMQRGGFDAVIGNPPYVRMEVFKNIKQYLKEHYSCHDERADLYTYIIEKGHKLLNKSGLFGMIVSNKFLRANYGLSIRNFLSKSAQLLKIIDLAGLPVFPGVTVRTIVLISRLSTNQPYNLSYVSPLTIQDFERVAAMNISLEYAIQNRDLSISSKKLHEPFWAFSAPDDEKLFRRILNENQNLKSYCDDRILRGVVSGLTDAFVIDQKIRDSILEKNPEANEIIKPFVNGKNVRKYQIDWDNRFLIYTFHGIDIKKYPGIIEHLKPFKDRLQMRATKQEWYELQQPQYAYLPFFEGPKIIFPDIAKNVRFSLDEKGFFGSNTIYFIPKSDKYLLGLLNSKMGYYFFYHLCAGLEGKNETYLRFFGQYLEHFPIRTINFSDPADKGRHDTMVALVERMLALHRQRADVKTDHEKNLIERQIEATDKQIDALVYDLYDLTEEEIRIVEGAGK